MRHTQRFRTNQRTVQEFAEAVVLLEAMGLENVLREQLSSRKIEFSDANSVTQGAMEFAYSQGFNACIDLLFSGVLSKPIDTGTVDTNEERAELRGLGYTDDEIDSYSE